LISEFNARQRLAKLGFTEDFGCLEGFTADCFLIISDEIDKVTAEESKRKRRK